MILLILTNEGIEAYKCKSFYIDDSEALYLESEEIIMFSRDIYINFLELKESQSWE